MRRVLRTAWLVIADILLINIAYILAFVLKFEFDVESAQFDAWFVVYVDNILQITACSLLVTALLGSYSAIWRYAGRRELAKLIIGVWLASAVSAEYMKMTGQTMPTSIYIVAALISTILLPGLRAIIKEYRRMEARRKLRRQALATGTSASGGAAATAWDSASGGVALATGTSASGGAAANVKRVIVLGADEAGAYVIKACREHVEYGRKVVALLDDDPAKIGRKIDGVRVAGSLAQISKLLADFSADEVLVGRAYTRGKNLDDIVDACARSGCKIKLLPSFGELLGTKAAMRDISRADVERLVSRNGEGSCFDENELRVLLSGRVVLVTGGGGRIGGELCRKIAKYKPRRLVVLDVCESGAYELARELSEKQPELEIETLIGSTCDRAYMERVMAKYVPHIIFHLAAYSAYDSEGFPEAVTAEVAGKNLVSARNVMELAEEYAAQRFVLVEGGLAGSMTDSSEGRAGKAAAANSCEALLLEKSLAARNTSYLALRFGLVLSSDSPMIKRIKRQIAEGGPVRICAERKLRCISAGEAACDILAAFADSEKNEENGRVLCADMGEERKFSALAEDMVRLAGYIPGVDIEIK